MTKHHWRQQIESFFDSHADPDKHEQQKQTRKDMEERKEKIIKLINGEDQAVSSNGKAASLEELVRDYHKEYDSLYELYHNFTAELRNKVHGKKDAFSSSSSSDTDSDTGKSHSKQGARNRKLENESLKRELEAANREIDGLRKKLAAANDEKEALRSELESSKAGLVSKTEIMRKFENENAGLRSKIVDLELNVRSAERKAEEVSRGNQSNDQLVAELQATIEDLRRDVEMDKDELVSIEEKNRNLEVMLRLSNQKVRVTEQLLSEKEASHNVLEARNTTLTQTLEEYSGMIKEISERVNALVNQLEYETTKKLDKDYGGLAKSIAALSEEVKGVKSWVAGLRAEKEEMEKVKGEKETKENVVKEEVARALSQLDEAVKEKDERLLHLGEEKRDAIRHLCVWIEYYRSRCIELQRILLKVAPKERKTTPP